LLKEKEALDLELFECKRELKSHMNDTNETMQKEIKLLKQMIKNIEEDSLKDKTNYQKQLHKKTKEINQLIEEIEEVRASERNLKHQLKSLQTELAVYRRK
jgi:coiled-coil domain-containing protein 61